MRLHANTFSAMLVQHQLICINSKPCGKFATIFNEAHKFRWRATSFKRFSMISKCEAQNRALLAKRNLFDTVNQYSICPYNSSLKFCIDGQKFD